MAPTFSSSIRLSNHLISILLLPSMAFPISRGGPRTIPLLLGSM